MKQKKQILLRVFFYFSHCYKRMKFKRKKKEKVAHHGHASFKFLQCSAVCISIFRLSNWYYSEHAKLVVLNL